MMMMKMMMTMMMMMKMMMMTIVMMMMMIAQAGQQLQSQNMKTLMKVLLFQSLRDKGKSLRKSYLR